MAGSRVPADNALSRRRVMIIKSDTTSLEFSCAADFRIPSWPRISLTRAFAVERVTRIELP